MIVFPPLDSWETSAVVTMSTRCTCGDIWVQKKTSRGVGRWGEMLLKTIDPRMDAYK